MREAHFPAAVHGAWTRKRKAGLLIILPVHVARLVDTWLSRKGLPFLSLDSGIEILVIFRNRLALHADFSVKVWRYGLDFSHFVERLMGLKGVVTLGFICFFKVMTLGAQYMLLLIFIFCNLSESLLLSLIDSVGFLLKLLNIGVEHRVVAQQDLSPLFHRLALLLGCFNVCIGHVGYSLGVIAMIDFDATFMLEYLRRHLPIVRPFDRHSVLLHRGQLAVVSESVKLKVLLLLNWTDVKTLVLLVVLK